MAKAIMIVDDSTSLRQVVAISLKGAGYEVIEACDGQDALDRLKGQKINLVISDPNFQVEEIPAKFAALVTLNLAGSPSAQRQAALQAFRSKEATYAKRGLRQSAAGLKSASEVKFCTDSGFTMLSGPAVAGPERLLRPRPLPQQAVA